jgi:hypothetical protein
MREVEALFLRACATLATLPDRDRRFFHVETRWPLARAMHGLATRPRRSTTSPMCGLSRRPPITIECSSRSRGAARSITSNGGSCAIVRRDFRSGNADRVHIHVQAVHCRYDEALSTVVRAALADHS